jgi:hypothetical protein
LLKIKVSDVSDRTITLQEPKSGKESELAYMPENVLKKLAEYIKDKALQSDDRPLPRRLKGEAERFPYHHRPLRIFAWACAATGCAKDAPRLAAGSITGLRISE